MDDFPIEFEDTGPIEPEDTKLEPEEWMIKKYFRFLVDEYGLVYKKHNFTSEKVLVQVEPGHKTPRVYIFKVGEPTPDLFRLNFEWVFKYFHGTFPSDQHDYLQHGLDTNMMFISRLFHENSEKLINEFDTWWIPAHVFLYRWMENNARKKGQLERFNNNHEHYYDYLKSKGAV